MAHVHGAKTAKAVTEAAGAGASKMMESAMAGMGQMGEGMMHSAMVGATAGVAATAGKSSLKKILTHPVTLIGIGFALGYLAYKYRKDIIPQPSEE